MQNSAKVLRGHCTQTHTKIKIHKDLKLIKLLQRSAFIFVLLTFAVIGIAYVLPSSFEVSREITIDKAPQVVYSILADLEKWKPWDPWQKNDPGLSLSVTHRTQSGMKGKWLRDGRPEGTITLEKIIPDSRAEIFLQKGNEPKRKLVFDLKDLGGKTRLTWTVTGENGMYPIGNIFATQMDKYVGPIYEQALLQLKAYSEAAQPPTPSGK